MNATIMVCTRLGEEHITTTYINIENEIIYPAIISLKETPFRLVGNPDIPEMVGQTLVTIHRHEEKK